MIIQKVIYVDIGNFSGVHGGAYDMNPEQYKILESYLNNGWSIENSVSNHTATGTSGIAFILRGDISSDEYTKMTTISTKPTEQPQPTNELL